jgi:SAM-dependent methyltransferase
MFDPQGARYDSTRQAWEDIWQGASVEIELQAMEYRRSKQGLALYTPYLSKDDIILEAGSGLSGAVITLRRMGYNVVGLDYAINALQIARRYDSTQRLLAGDVHALPFPENALGGYLSFGVLEHFEHGMGPALAEAFRILKPGGVMVLTIPYPNVVNRFVAWRRKRQGTSVLTDDEFYESTYDRDALAGNVQRAGFEVLRAEPTSHAYTLWGLGGIFRGPGYYQTSALADTLGDILRVVLPWPFNFSTMVIARKP